MGAVMIAVGIRDDGKTGEVISVAEHGAHLHPVPGVPDGEPVAEQVLGGAAHSELNLQLPVS